MFICLQRKCDMYWPKDGVSTFGLIEVTLVNEEILSSYTIRKFRIRHTRIKHVNNASKQAILERMVVQYHFTNWPDNGIPSNPLPILNFVKKSSLANRENDGPIVVHCR